jgi:phosphotransferase system HPr (HPr) family protein
VSGDRSADRAPTASATVTVVDVVGLHATPADRFVRLADTFDATIVVRRGDRRADAKRLLGVLALEAHRGDVLRIDACGPDADRAVRQLRDLVADGAALR